MVPGFGQKTSQAEQASLRAISVTRLGHRPRQRPHRDGCGAKLTLPRGWGLTGDVDERRQSLRRTTVAPSLAQSGLTPYHPSFSAEGRAKEA